MSGDQSAGRLSARATRMMTLPAERRVHCRTSQLKALSQRDSFFVTKPAFSTWGARTVSAPVLRNTTAPGWLGSILLLDIDFASSTTSSHCQPRRPRRPVYEG